jgi:3-methylcrotonyl-CoA carboxylase alpha subunit
LRSNTFRLRLEESESVVEVLAFREGEIHATLDDDPIRAGFASDGLEVRISLHGTAYELSKPYPPDVDAIGGSAAEVAAGGLTAPMPGTVVKVLVEEGEEVEEGQLVLVLEAMKMEQPVTAPHAGRVASLPYGEGALVPGGAVLAQIEEP